MNHIPKHYKKKKVGVVLCVNTLADVQVSDMPPKKAARKKTNFSSNEINVLLNKLIIALIGVNRAIAFLLALKMNNPITINTLKHNLSQIIRYLCFLALDKQSVNCENEMFLI